VPRARAGWLQHPLTRGLDLDAPGTTILRRQIIRDKGFLRCIYREWYARLATALPAGEGVVLELGSGAGFLREVLPAVVASDVLRLPGLALVAAGDRLPFGDGALRAIVMTNVFHHLRDAGGFLREAARAVRAGGRLVMVEPWNTGWARFVYRHAHHEPFEPAGDWTLAAAEGRGPLTAANGALPWIVFARDRARLAAELPAWRIVSVAPTMPLAYLFSGGVSLRLGAPAAAYPLVRWVESLLPQRWCAMFALIVIERAAESRMEDRANLSPRRGSPPA